MLEYMADLIQADADRVNPAITVEYDGNARFTFEGRYVRVMANVYRATPFVKYSSYDTFNFGEITFANTDYFYKDDTVDALAELNTIFKLIADNDGVTVQM